MVGRLMDAAEWWLDFLTSDRALAVMLVAVSVFLLASSVAMFLTGGWFIAWAPLVPLCISVPMAVLFWKEGY